MSDTEFTKYIKDGAYHWDAASSSVEKHVAFTSGRYAVVMKQPVRWSEATVLDIACGDAIRYLTRISRSRQYAAAETIGSKVDVASWIIASVLVQEP